MEGYGKRVLVVDDDEDTRMLMGILLEQDGYNVVPVCDGLDALSELKKRHFDVVITDYSMPILNGRDLLMQIHSLWPGTPVILVSGKFPDLSEDEAGSYAYACLRKPYECDRLLEHVRSAAQTSLQSHSEGILSTAMRQE